MLNKDTYYYIDGLQSERLYTRFLTLEDISQWSAFFDSKIATEFTMDFGPITSEEKGKIWIEKQLNRYAENRYGLQAIILKSNGKLIGQCGLLHQIVNGKDELEVGYHFLPEYWGNSYAPEAAKTFMEFAKTHNLSDSITSLIAINNLRSQRVAEKNGLQREPQTTWMDKEIYVYRKAF